jgi:molybdate transport system permease protein
MIRAARTLGATPLRAFFTVHLPLAARGIYAGLMLAFARSLGDFGLTLVIGGNLPGETKTASIAIYDLIQAKKDAQALGLVAVFTAIALVTLYSVNKMTGRRHA